MSSLLRRSLESGRIHSAYLLSGPGSRPREAALAFVRGLVCRAGAGEACEECSECRRSSAREEIRIDGAGKKGPLLRHVGDHPDLLWVERGPDDTRVRIGQIRALQGELRLGAHAGGRRAAVVADAEWLNQEAQNALLRLLEEPPPDTSIVLVAASAAGLLATVRSRCQRAAFRPSAAEAESEEVRELVQRLDDLARAGVPQILDWAEEYRGARAVTAEGVQQLLEAASLWARRRIADAVRQPGAGVRAELDACRELSQCRQALVQRNANPQMVAERALLALRRGFAA